MKNNKEIKLIYDRDRCWLSMREKIEDLLSILGGKKPTIYDARLGWECLNLVLLEFYFNEIEEENINNYDKKNIIADFFIEIKKFSKVADKNISTEEKQALIDNMRTKVWKDISKEKKEIEIIRDNNMSFEKMKYAILVLRCISVICFELRIRDVEIAVLNNEI